LIGPLSSISTALIVGNESVVAVNADFADWVSTSDRARTGGNRLVDRQVVVASEHVPSDPTEEDTLVIDDEAGVDAAVPRGTPIRPSPSGRSSGSERDGSTAFLQRTSRSRNRLVLCVSGDALGRRRQPSGRPGRDGLALR
jgi:hypothetical protein